MSGTIFAILFLSTLLLIVSGVMVADLGAIAIKTLVWVKRVKRKTELESEKILQNTKYSINKIASMSPSDLEVYLTKIFSLVLELSSAEFISERDPHGRTNLYKTALAQFVQYLGDAYDAIEYYYGNGYVVNWFSLQYRLLDLHGEIDKIVHRTSRYADRG